MNQNEAKLLFRGYGPLHARRRFIEAMVPEAPLDHIGLGLTKPATFLRLRSPSHERACIEQHEASLALLAIYLPESFLIYTTDGRLLNSGVHVILSA